MAKTITCFKCNGTGECPGGNHDCHRCNGMGVVRRSPLDRDDSHLVPTRYILKPCEHDVFPPARMANTEPTSLARCPALVQR